MAIKGTREQLAALLVEGENRLPGPALTVHGTPGNWSVAVTDSSADAVWLASERHKSQMRCFKTLDAAHAAAVAVHRMAHPLKNNFATVRIVMDLRQEQP